MNDGISKRVEDEIQLHVLRDLDPPWMLVHTKVALAAVVGGLASLLICGQFGVGLTPAATALNHTIHESMGPIPCAIVCGVMYAIFPIAMLRFALCGPLQFRAITKRRWQSLLLWFGGFGGVMASFGHHGDSALTFSGWILAAIFAANVLARGLYAVVPAWDLPLRLKTQR